MGQFLFPPPSKDSQHSPGSRAGSLAPSASRQEVSNVPAPPALGPGRLRALHSPSAGRPRCQCHDTRRRLRQGAPAGYEVSYLLPAGDCGGRRASHAGGDAANTSLGLGAGRHGAAGISAAPTRIGTFRAIPIHCRLGPLSSLIPSPSSVFCPRYCGFVLFSIYFFLSVESGSSSAAHRVACSIFLPCGWLRYATSIPAPLNAIKC